MTPHDDRAVIGVPLGTRLRRIIRVRGGWMIWTATADYVHGTYFLLGDDGSIVNVTVRAGEGDDAFVVRPPDATC